MKMTMATKKIKIPWNPIFKEVNQTKKRYRVLKGSAGSGKSVDIAQDYIKKLSNPKYKGANLVCVRKVDVSNRHSTFAELKAAIIRLFGADYESVWKINESTMEMQCLNTGNQIIFRGVNHEKDREKLKSINFPYGKLTWVWIEEATELYEADVDILDDRLRGLLNNPNLYYQITMTFNPVSATHWIKKKYFDYQDDDIFTHHSTYLQNRFIDEAYHRRMMRRKSQDPDGYKIYGLGEWGEVGGLILSNYHVKEFNTNEERFDNVVHSQDFGYNHANAILTVGFKDGDFYICDEVYEYEKDTEELIKIAKNKEIDKRHQMPCDSAEPDRVKMWQKSGFKAYGVKKGKGSVNAQIDWLKQRKIYIHPRCTNTIKEIQQWKWKKDEKTNAYMDEPVNIFDDAMAALRYAAVHFMGERKLRTRDKALFGL